MNLNYNILRPIYGFSHDDEKNLQIKKMESYLIIHQLKIIEGK